MVPIESSYDFPLVINSSIYPILHRLQVMADYWSNFRLRVDGQLTLTPSLGVIPCEFPGDLYLFRN